MLRPFRPRGDFCDELPGPPFALRTPAQALAWQAIRRGWCLGGKEFRQELLAESGERAGQNHAGPELAESDEQKALRIVEGESRRHRWTREQLTGWRKGDKRKVRIALRLRRETTMALKWMAEQLAMGTWANVARRLYEAKS